MKKKGFTLVELLAVIVILAVILIIAIPQIMNTIKQTRLKSMESSAKLIAAQAEKDYLAEKTLNSNYNVTTIPCSDVAKVNDDYSDCSITYNENGVATIELNGASGGKFNNIECIGTRNNMVCSEIESFYFTAELPTEHGAEGTEFNTTKDNAVNKVTNYSNLSNPFFVRESGTQLSICGAFNGELVCVNPSNYNLTNMDGITDAGMDLKNGIEAAGGVCSTDSSMISGMQLLCVDNTLEVSNYADIIAANNVLATVTYSGSTVTFMIGNSPFNFCAFNQAMEPMCHID
ncbi:MAG: prepilin-type N-terminal cleavage/methylation domain-containing protein [Bacilli bacterium]|nr:prepilin-type N-terminal cleavage/methylation domain-containing protein [Bacilli bacterium]